MSAGTPAFPERYAAALRAALAEHGESGLSSAYELGRRAVNERLGVLDLAAVHHDALAAELAGAPDAGAAERAARAAGDFFLESLSAFEMLQRVLQDARDEARLEQRHAALLRRLSDFLADASLAVDAAGSLEEMLQLVAEHALELVDARAAVARLDRGGAGQAACEALAAGDDPPPDDVVARVPAVYAALRPTGGPLRTSGGEDAGDGIPGGLLAAPLTALDGRDLGLLALVDRTGGDFTELDEAVLVQLAQMASAAVERLELYGRRD